MGWKMLFEEFQDGLNDLIYFKPPCCMIPPIKFQLKRICGLEEVV